MVCVMRQAGVSHQSSLIRKGAEGHGVRHEAGRGQPSVITNQEGGIGPWCAS